MNERDKPLSNAVEESGAVEATDLLRVLMQEPVGYPRGLGPGLVTGKLLALAAEGGLALVSYEGQPGHAALEARSVVDLHGTHIGWRVLLGFENHDPKLPIVLGILQGQPGWPLRQPPAQVTVEADGQRMVVVAHRELLLRCGKASISLRSDGHVEIRGETVVTQAAAANRIRGGSVELN
jgi:hypothetical protein